MAARFTLSPPHPVIPQQWPRAGEVGYIASLLEVGAGFHPELTGRENIYLNGAMGDCGMQKWEWGIEEASCF